MRHSGIDVIGDVPWGTHFCQFYRTAQDLEEILVPYFREGLAQGEFCMWVTAEPLEKERARTALRGAVPDIDDRIAAGQMEILDYRDWYIPDGRFDADRVLRGWKSRLELAQSKGFPGLRLTGNTFWLEPALWRDFTDYEELIDRTIGEQPMVALCTYSLDRCGADEILDVVSNHRFALIKRDGRWQTIESGEHRRMEQALRDSEAALRGFFDSNAIFMSVMELRGRDFAYLHPNRMMADFFGITPESMAGKTGRELGLDEPVIARWLALLRDCQAAGRPVSLEYEFSHGSRSSWYYGTLCPIAGPPERAPRFSFAAVDVAETRCAREDLKLLNEQLERRVAERSAEAQQKTEQLRALTLQLTETAELERKRLAQVLHDDLQQLLVAAKMRLEMLSARAADGKLVAEVRGCVEMLSQSIDVSRSLTTELSPPALNETDFGAALRWLARHMQERHRLAVTVVETSPCGALPEGARVLLFHAVRELLFNIVKHARTDRARLTMGKDEGGGLSVIIEDEGAGFDIPSRSLQGHGVGFGLFSISERLQMIGGRLDVASEPGYGTRVSIVLPPVESRDVSPAGTRS